ncbi:hypothetical protein AUJ46_04480 [Candidatus Peregrinibacteria bacterium CG1_02_54_53]|nr:MAG: hypothetical protein AUJ46_04480 [Candidatus Peregrinibacteria bacterium CG1_02_54_53]
MLLRKEANTRFAVIGNDCYDALVPQMCIMCSKFTPRACTAIFVFSLLLPNITAAAKTKGFSDVASGTPVAEAAEYLRSVGILSGYEDGTFRPSQNVNRAEAIKIIIAPLLKKEALDQLTQTPFSDIQAGEWYLPYVEAARQNSIVDGPPAKPAFNGTQPVTKMEFIKMVLLAYRIDPSSYSEIRLPLSSDVTDPAAWYYPYLRYAITASMTMVTGEGTFDPGRSLTRGDTALILYRFLMYRNGKRTQALLSEAENEILVVLGSIKENNLEQAEYASGRALLAARGANAGSPNQPIVQGALKITEAFRAIVRAYRAGVNQQFDETIRLCGDAWNLATRGKELSSELASLSDQVQTLAKNLADTARAAKAGPVTP